jgi:hypothetical protein
VAGIVALVAGAAACGDSSSGGSPGAGGAMSATSSSRTSGSTRGGSSASTSSGSASAGSGSSGAGSSGPMWDGGTAFAPGNPNGSCTAGVPARGQLVDTSSPTTKVGSGTSSSCTSAALAAAVATGGTVTFDCGSAPTTITVSSTLAPPLDKNTVIDGAGLITLDGAGTTQILSFASPGWGTNDNGVTLQRIRLVNGKTTPMQAIPVAPAPCSQGYDDGEGGAVYVRDGSLTIIDSIFDSNQAALLGPDTGGGAIYVNGSKGGILIVHSTFTNNRAANGGAVGSLFSELDVYDSVFTGNVATGHGANNNDPSQCSVMNNGQNEVGSGGNGGALYNDGAAFKDSAGNVTAVNNLVFCGDDIENNAADPTGFGGGIFFTSNDWSGTLTITDSTIEGNSGGHWTNVKSGSVTNAGTAVGTNAKSISIANSTIQGAP